MNFAPHHSDKPFKTQALPAQLAFHLPMKNRMLLIRLKKGTLFSEYKKYQNHKLDSFINYRENLRDWKIKNILE